MYKLYSIKILFWLTLLGVFKTQGDDKSKKDEILE